MEQKQRREPRYPFIASAELLEENSGARMKSRISDLRLNGCYAVTRWHARAFENIYRDAFVRSTGDSRVYSHAFMGMGMKFPEVQPKSEEVLRLWLPEAAEQTNKAHG